MFKAYVMAFMGKVVTLPSIRVHRALGGSTVSHANIAETLGLSKWQGAYPHVVTALSAFREIAWRDPVYSLGRIDRARLAWQCQKIIRLRRGFSVFGILRRSLVLGRHVVSKRLFGSPQK